MNDRLPPSYAASFDHLGQEEQQICQILLRCSSVLSIGGSSYIVYSLLGPRRESELKTKLFNRLLLGLSVSDVLSSLLLFLGAWPMPADSLHSASLHANLGNQATCDAQGMGLQVFYFSSIYYTACLSLHFLLYVKYQWTEQQLTRRAEPYMHVACWFLPLMTALICFAFDMYNPTAFFCYVVTYPVVSTKQVRSCMRTLMCFIVLLTSLAYPQPRDATITMTCPV